MDAKTYRHHQDYPYVNAASDQELLDAALCLLPATVLEEHLRKQRERPEENTISSIVEQMSEERKRRARTALLPAHALKTQPIIVRETGRVFRAQGRPPKHVQPIYVETEAEALQILSEI